MPHYAPGDVPSLIASNAVKSSSFHEITQSLLRPNASVRHRRARFARSRSVQLAPPTDEIHAGDRFMSSRTFTRRSASPRLPGCSHAGTPALLGCRPVRETDRTTGSRLRSSPPQTAERGADGCRGGHHGLPPITFAALWARDLNRRWPTTAWMTSHAGGAWDVRQGVVAAVPVNAFDGDTHPRLNRTLPTT
jgi:hypothetical protein